MNINSIKTIYASYNHVRSYQNKLMLILFLVVLGLGLSVLQPILWGHLLESVLKLDVNTFKILIPCLLGLFILDAAIIYFQASLKATVNENIKYEMKRNIFSKILNYQMNYINKMGIGDVLSHLENDVEVVVKVYTGQVLDVIIAILKAIIIGTIAFIISWPLAIVIIMMLPINYFILNKFGKKMKETQIELRKNMDEYFSKTQEYVTNIESVKVFGIKKYIISKFNKLINVNKMSGIRIGRLVAGSSGSAGLINFFTQILVYSLGIYLLLNNKLTFALFVAFSSYTALLSEALIGITRINPILQQAVVSINRVNKILTEFEDKPEAWGDTDVCNTKGKIDMKNITFGYSDHHILFTRLNLSFDSKRKYAIVGSSGSGKSSLFRILLKVYDVQSGVISFDGIDISEINEDSFRSIIGMVPQEPILFNMSIMDNIKLENPTASEKQVYEAAKMANIHDEIMKLSEGYKTIINGLKDNLSVGQKQRVCIARALLKNPKILLFDEVTSALDNISRELINNTIDSLRKTCTVIVISHKVSNIINADEIIVLNNGELVGKGRHKELINNCEYYRNLYGKQKYAVC